MGNWMKETLNYRKHPSYYIYKHIHTYIVIIIDKLLTKHPQPHGVPKRSAIIWLTLRLFTIFIQLNQPHQFKPQTTISISTSYLTLSLIFNVLHRIHLKFKLFRCYNVQFLIIFLWRFLSLTIYTLIIQNHPFMRSIKS